MTSIIKVDEIQNKAGTSAITIDSSGRVLRSAVPAWRVGLSTTQPQTSSGTKLVPFDTYNTQNCFLQGGVTLSSGTITVPVAGLYKVGSTIRVDDVNTAIYIISYIRKNQANQNLEDSYVLTDNHGVTYQSLTVNDLYQCEAGDELECYINVQSGDSSWELAQNVSHFNGHLVG